MSFSDIINQEQKKLEESQGGNAKVEYPETKHKRLFFEKGQKELFLQVLPSADLVSAFAVPSRKIFLTTKSSNGKEINSNFVLSPEPNQGSLLEQKIAEWAEKGMIPNKFGGQASPKRVYFVNVVKVLQNQQGQYVQERDEQGNLVVRVFEMAQSAYGNLLRKLGDPLYNGSGTELSFMDINKPSPIKISKPAQGQMEYHVDVYAQVVMPPLGQGWENQLEDLNALATPTEYLPNGDQWVKAFIDMKEGRKPNQRSGGDSNQTQGQPQSPQTNPYANQGQQQQPTQQMPQVPQQPQQPQTQTGHQQPVAPPQEDNLNNMMDSGSTGAPQMPQAPQQPQQNQAPQQQTPQAPQQQMPSTPQQNQAPQTPQQQAPQVPQQEAPNQNVSTNNNGLADIDSMLEQELNGGNQD